MQSACKKQEGAYLDNLATKDRHTSKILYFLIVLFSISLNRRSLYCCHRCAGICVLFSLLFIVLYDCPVTYLLDPYMINFKISSTD